LNRCAPLLLTEMRVYKVIQLDTKGCVYVGSTHQSLCERKAQHHQKVLKNSPTNFHRHIISNGGWENYEFQEVAEYGEISREELLLREREAIELLNPLCNIQRNTIRSDEDTKAYYKGYYAERKEQKCKYSKDWAKKPFECECGSIVRWGEKARHFKSDKHKRATAREEL
jgi:hypothetical protein